MSPTAVQSIPTGAWKIDPVHSRVGFAVKHMVISTFRGQFGRYDGRLADGPEGAPRLEGWVDASSIEARDDNLAAHLASPDFFDTERHPRIGFTSTALQVGVELEIFDELAAIPPYSEDVEHTWPGPVARLRDAIAAANGVLVVTPEYNGSIPGQLKNALDWASRPAGASPLAAKPAAVL